MDLIKAIFSSGNIRKKELGLPRQLPWQYSNGLWVPYDNRDNTYIERAFKAVSIIQAIVTKIIDKASDAPGQVMRIKSDRTAKGYFAQIKGAKSSEAIFKSKMLKVKAFEEMDSHPFLEVMDNPNPMQTGKELRESSMGYLLLTGNAFEYAASPDSGGRAGQPRQLWSIPSPCVQRKVGDRMQPIDGYFISYMGQDAIPSEKIMDVRYWNPIGSDKQFIESYNGLSPLRSSVGLVSQKKFADTAQGTLFANMAPAGILSGDPTRNKELEEGLTQEQASQIDERFKQQHTGVHNGGGVMVTPAAVNWQSIGLSPVDLNILDFNKDLERQIALIYSWPVNLLQPGGVVSNSEVSAKQIITDCVMPLLRRFDDARTQKIREWYKDDSLVYISDLQYYSELSEDREKQVKWLKDAYWLTMEEKRRVMDYEEDFDADKVLVPSSLAMLSDILGGDLNVDENSEDFPR